MNEVYELSHRAGGHWSVHSHHLTLEGAQRAAQGLQMEPFDGWNSWSHTYEDIWVLYCTHGVLMIKKLEVEP